MAFSIFAAPSREKSITFPTPSSAFPSFAARCGHSVLGLAFAISLLANTAHAVVIDDFFDPVPGTSYAIDFLDPDPLVLKQSPLVSTVGGERDLMVDVIGLPVGPVSATGTVGGGTYIFGTLGDRGSSATLQYDGVDNLDILAPPGAATLVNAEGLNLDLTSDGAVLINFRFLSVDGAAAGEVGIRITATSAGGSASYVGAVPNFSGPEPWTDYQVLYTALTTVGAFDLTAVTSLQVTFNETGVPDIDFELADIRTNIVPEPSSMVLLGCGGLAGLLVLRRRRAA